MGTFASEIEARNIATILSFLDIPNVRSLNGRFFKNMEAIIGEQIRKVTIESMGVATDLEVKMTLDNENISNNTKIRTY